MNSLLRRAILLVTVLLLQVRSATASVLAFSTQGLTRLPISGDLFSISSSEAFLGIRGGASRSRKRTSAKSRAASRSSSNKTATGRKKVGASAESGRAKTSALGDTMIKYKRILPLTRMYITMIGAATLLGLVLGDDLTQGLLAFNSMRVVYGLELWRPFTAASFLGPPSIGWLMNGYYLFEYGSSLERAYGTAQHLIFLMSQVLLLSLFSSILDQPFFAGSMITSMLHVLSRATPHQKVRWLIFNVPYWSLPYGLMATDVLQAGNALAAVPHVLGILSGHFYQFHKFVWPKVGGVDWLLAPSFLTQRLDPNSCQTNNTGTKSVKSKRRGKGRKLGSSK